MSRGEHPYDELRRTGVRPPELLVKLTRLGPIRADVHVADYALCASCTRYEVPYVRRAIGRNDGVVSICADCDGATPSGRVPESQQRGYDNDGGTGQQFARQVAAAFHRIVRKSDPRVGMMPLRDKCEPNHELVRLSRRDRDGKPIDKREALQLYGTPDLVHVATDARWHVFQRATPTRDVPDVLTAMEPWRRKA